MPPKKGQNQFLEQSIATVYFVSVEAELAQNGPPLSV